jgi:predicted ATP-dependent serine protease
MVPDKPTKPTLYRCQQCGKNVRKDHLTNGVCRDCQRWNALLPGRYVLGNNLTYDAGFIAGCVCPPCPERVCKRDIEKRQECAAVLQAKQDRQNQEYKRAVQPIQPVRSIQAKLELVV